MVAVGRDRAQRASQGAWKRQWKTHGEPIRHHTVPGPALLAALKSPCAAATAHSSWS